MLDLESVRLFVLAVDLGGLTRAAEASGTVQPVVSQRLKVLEEQLGTRLLERTPRFVRPTADGAVFLEKARILLTAHEAATSFRGSSGIQQLRLGVSDHVMGAAAPLVLRRLRTALPPDIRLELRVSFSQILRSSFDAGDLDAVIIRREAGGTDGEVLGIDPLIWCGDAMNLPACPPLPIASLGEPCGVRATAIRALQRAGISWRESLVAGSCSALLAAVSAGFGVTPLGRFGAFGDDIGTALGLPELPRSEIILLGRASTPALAENLSMISANLRALLFSTIKHRV
jgi:DNA-binding transcriptional LysR family regulator